MKNDPDKLFTFLCRSWVILFICVFVFFMAGIVAPIINAFVDATVSPEKEAIISLYKSNEKNLNTISDKLLEENYEDFAINSGYDENGVPFADFAYDYIQIDDELLIMCDSLISSGEFNTIYKDLEKNDVYFFNVEKTLIKPRKGIAFSLETPTNEYELYEHIEGNWYYYEEIE